MAKKLCSIEGCEEKHHAKGYCRKHYNGLKRHGDPLFNKAERKCSVKGCNGKHKGRNYCNKHYQIYKRYGDPLFILPKKKCIVKGCEKKHSGLGYCTKHYQRFKSYGDPLFIKLEKHSMSNTPTYSSWSSMKSRCSNPDATGYEKWGGRGIKVCERWMDFKNFYEDMGDRPQGTSLDRIDNNGNYEPDNCKWSTPQEQAENRGINSNNKTGCAGVHIYRGRFKAMIKHKGETYFLKSHDTLEEAIIARLKGELKYLGEIKQTQFEYLLI